MKKEIFKRKDKISRKITNKSKGRRKKILAGICALVLLSGGVCGAVYKSRSGGQSVKAATQMSAQAQIGDVSTTISSSGTLEGKESSVVQIPAGIKIKEVLVSEGDAVKKGTKLASLYTASVAEVLLDVKESIDTVESDLEDLDEDDITDTTSEDYLKKLTYDQELKDLEALEKQLQGMLETGYIQADTTGIIGNINVADDTIAGTSSTDSSTTESIGTGYGAGASASDGKAVNSILLSTVVNILSDAISADSSESSDDSGSPTESAYQSASEASEDTTETDKSNEEGSKDTADSSTSSENDTGSVTDADSSSDAGSASTGSASSSTTSSGQTDGKTETTEEKGNNGTSTTSGTKNVNGKQGGASTGINAGMSGTAGQSLSAGSTETSAESDTIADIEMVNAFVLNSDSQMLVTVSVDEADIGSVQEGQTAQVAVTALSEQTFDGEISGISNVSSSSGSSVKYEVEITIDKTDAMLSGMSASATIYIDKVENAVTIPSAAVQEKGGKAYVYTQKDSDGNLGGETEVTTGLSDGNQVEITDGLSEGDTVYYEIYSSGNSGDSSGEMDFGKMRDFNGGSQNGEDRGPGSMPGNPPSGSQDRSN